MTNSCGENTQRNIRENVNNPCLLARYNIHESANTATAEYVQEIEKHQKQTRNQTASEIKTGIQTYDVDDWWAKWHPIARAETRPPRTFAKDAEGHPVYNPYAGDLAAWQLRETVDEYLARTRNMSGRRTLLRVANPYSPPHWKPARDTYCRAGKERLRMFSDFIKFYGYGNETGGKRDLGDIRMEREEVMRNLTRLADVCELRAGKWIIHVPHDRCEEAWRKIVTATVKNELGSEACVKRGDSESSAISGGKLFKVFTRDYRDKAEAARLLGRLDKLGILNRDKEIYYKSGSFPHDILPPRSFVFWDVGADWIHYVDALSHLDLYSYNIWGLKTSLVSIDIHGTVSQAFLPQASCSGSLLAWYGTGTNKSVISQYSATECWELLDAMKANSTNSDDW